VPHRLKRHGERDSRGMKAGSNAMASKTLAQEQTALSSQTKPRSSSLFSRVKKNVETNFAAARSGTPLHKQLSVLSLWSKRAKKEEEPAETPRQIFIHGLKKQSELNGEEVTVVERFGVKVKVRLVQCGRTLIVDVKVLRYDGIAYIQG